MPNALSAAGWLLFVIAAIAVGVVIVAYVRRWARRDEPVHTFTFQDLRDMRTRGDITEAEFNAMRGALLADLSVEQPPDPGPAPPASPTPQSPPE